MKIKIKSGEKITAGEFLTRWKKGIAEVTPLEQTKNQLRFTWITILGIVCGIVICIVNIKTLWWLMIILVGALGNTTLVLMGTIQKKKMLDQIEGGMKNGS